MKTSFKIILLHYWGSEVSKTVLDYQMMIKFMTLRVIIKFLFKLKTLNFGILDFIILRKKDHFALNHHFYHIFEVRDIFGTLCFTSTYCWWRFHNIKWQKLRNKSKNFWNCYKFDSLLLLWSQIFARWRFKKWFLIQNLKSPWN